MWEDERCSRSRPWIQRGVALDSVFVLCSAPLSMSHFASLGPPLRSIT